MAAGKKPDFDLSIKLSDEKWHKIGVAWRNENTSISIEVNALVTLPVGPLRLSLFVRDYTPRDPTKKSYTSGKDLANELEQGPFGEGR